MPGQYIKLGPVRFLPHPFQYINHLSPFHSTVYGLSYSKESANKLQINATSINTYLATAKASDIVNFKMQTMILRRVCSQVRTLITRHLQFNFF
jgi:hypothetical protein